MENLNNELKEAARQLGASLLAAGESVTAAESCTGGMVASALTGVAGSSAWFSQSWVTYSNEAKQQMLDVPEGLLQQHGAVSREVVEAMAAGARHKASSTLSMAISGIAGPGGGTDDKPVGTVWIAWACDGDLASERFLFPGDRETVRLRSALAAIIGAKARSSIQPHSLR